MTYKTITVIIGGIPITIHYSHNRITNAMRDYLYDGNGDIDITVTARDIEAERKNSSENESDGYLELIACARLIFSAVAERSAILFHSCVIEYKGKAYLFAAPSGTGKSTHAGLWQKMLGDRVKILNGDKPMLRVIDGLPTTFGTPFCGKEGWGYNGNAPIGGICFIYRSENNTIRRITSSDAIVKAYMQTFRPPETEKTSCIMQTLTAIINGVPLWELGCNISPEAAKLSFENMTGDKV